MAYDEDEEVVEDTVDEDEEDIAEETPMRGWAPTAEDAEVAESIHIETGRGQTAEAQVGAPFVATVERIADEAHYGGYFRVFLNGDELTEDPWLDVNRTQLNPRYPDTIEPGMRIAITSYDKVG